MDSVDVRPDAEQLEVASQDLGTGRLEFSIGASFLFEFRLRADIDVAEREQPFARMLALASEMPGFTRVVSEARRRAGTA